MQHSEEQNADLIPILQPIVQRLADEGLAGSTEQTPEKLVVSRRRTTIINLSFQYGSLILTLVHGILMVPLYLHFIDEGLYGAWLASGNVLYLAATAQGGVTYLLAQRSAQLFGERAISSLGETIGSGLLLLAMLSSVVSIIILCLIPFIPTWFQVEGPQRAQLITCLLIMIPSVWLRLQIMGLIAIEQGLQRPFGVGTVTIVAGILHLAATIALLILGFGLLSIPLAILLREVICVVPLLWLMVRSKQELQLPIRFSTKALTSLSRLSVWTFLTFLNDALANGTTLLLVGLILGKEKVPLVTVSRAAWEILTLVLRRFVESVQPSLAHLRGEATRELIAGIAKQALLIVIAGLGIGVAGIIALNAPFVALWVNQHLYAGDTFNYLYAFAVICDVVATTICQLSLSLGKIRNSSIAQTTILVSRVVLLAALLPLTGMLAVPTSMILAVLIGIVPLLQLWQASADWEYSLLINAIRPVGVPVAGILIGHLGHKFLQPKSWPELFVDATAITIIACTTILALAPSLIVTIRQTIHGAGLFRQTKKVCR